jgi:LPS-assembly protein
MRLLRKCLVQPFLSHPPDLPAPVTAYGLPPSSRSRVRTARHRGIVTAACVLAALAAADARAQQRVTTPVGETTTSDTRQLINNKDSIFLGRVEMVRGDTTIYADEMRVFGDTNQAIATGNVVFSQGNNRIAAERAEFDTETRLGVFYSAYGSASIKPPPVRASSPGLSAPPMPVGQETDVYFYGDTVEKLGPRKYKITNGGFTTCVQPTPRWQLTSSTVTLNIDHYTILKSAVFSVKGVPMLYTPILYYPTKRENRATGILLPTYGVSTLHGQSIHNAFFWAINRSQDATFMHDWYTTSGQGLGGEYRYNYGNGTDGNFNLHWLDQKETPYTGSDGKPTSLPAERSYEIRGSANQGLSTRYRARANVNYFSSVVSMQTFNTNIYDASRNTRSYGGNVIGLSKGFSFNGTVDHNEYFYARSSPDVEPSSTLTGAWPRFTVSRNERPIGKSDLYYTVGAEYVYLLRNNITGTTTGTTEDNSSLARYDLNPQIRYPFKKLQWFTINSTVSWRDTYYSRSYVVNADGSKKLVDDGVNRRFFQFQSQLLGPVFTRIWNTPENGYAERFKHSVEPFLNLDRTTSIDNFDNIVQLEGLDYIVGGATRYTYGVNNRFYAKRRPPPESPVRFGQAREIVDIEFSQSYYTDPRAAQYDSRYSTSFTGIPPSNFSPLLLSVRTMPTDQINATVRAEWDSRYLALRTISASGSYSITNLVTTTANWTKNAYIAELPGFNDPANLSQGISAQANVHTRDNRYGSIYSFNYDVLHSAMVQQRITGFYNAQCCGLSFEYQTYNLSGSYSSLAIPVDRRFFMSFTLAGLGNFSPFNGALGGVPR